ncbi:MAG: efflux RND transporter periplasmic adaptor subunit, partial [Longimicrobiaceae bacterium]
RADVLERDELIAAQEAERLRSESAVAAADVGLARLRVRNATIRSPIGGVVTHRMVEPGQLVTSATPTFGIAETSRLEAEIGIPEREAGRIRRGQQAILRVEGTTTTIQGEVSRVRPVVDAESGTVQVTVEVDPATTPQLRPGQFVNVEIVTDRLQDRITLPRTAVLVDGPQPRVFVLQGGVAEERTVTLGRSEGERVEIERGVAPGDTVVTVGQDGLRPQAPVRLIELNGEPVAQSAAPAGPRESAPPGERRQARRRRPDAGR